MSIEPGELKAIVFDLDGTLAIGGDPIPGARESVARLRASGLPLRIVTNTTRHSRRSLAERLDAGGFGFAEPEIFNVPAIAAAWLRGCQMERVMPILARLAWADLGGLQLVSPDRYRGEPVDAVLVGDPGPELTYDALNHGFRAVRGGARLVACQRNRYWQEKDGLSLDAGPLVVALEYAAGVEAELVGKPSSRFFLMAVESLGILPAGVLMVGDDLDSDVGGAQAAGLRGCLVRTGKFGERDFEGSPVRPDLTIDSVADLPAVLGL